MDNSVGCIATEVRIRDESLNSGKNSVTSYLLGDVS